MNKIDWLPKPEMDHNKEPMYDLDGLKLRSDIEVQKLNENLYLVLKFKDSWLDFAALEFSESDLNDKNVKVSVLFYGSGATGTLRECRHTYWGPLGDGYVFYPAAKNIASAFTALSKYFDLD